MNNISTLNGLLDGISVLEHSNENQQPTYHSDLLYNEQEPIDLALEKLYYDEGYAAQDYRVEDFGESITLLSTITMREAIVGSSDIL